MLCLPLEFVSRNKMSHMWLGPHGPITGPRYSLRRGKLYDALAIYSLLLPYRPSPSPCPLLPKEIPSGLGCAGGFRAPTPSVWNTAAFSDFPVTLTNEVLLERGPASLQHQAIAGCFKPQTPKQYCPLQSEVIASGIHHG